MKPTNNSPTEELVPTWDTTPPPLAAPVADVVSAEAVPLAAPVVPDLPAPLAEAVPPTEPPAPVEAEAPAEAAPPAPPPGPVLCPVCGSPRAGEQKSCSDCGFYFPANFASGDGTAAPKPPQTLLQNNRFELLESINERRGVVRFKGMDQGDGSGQPVPVMIIREEAPKVAAAAPAEAFALTAKAEEASEDIIPAFEEPQGVPTTEILPARPTWPSIAWEQTLLNTLENPGLPDIVAEFTEGDYHYLVEEVPQGQSLWDAWDEPDATSSQRYGYLATVAEILHDLHKWQAMLEGIRPGQVVITADGRVRINDLSDILPLPVPLDAPIRGTLYTAPELLAGNGKADARSELYSFGGLIYSLFIGRELSVTDFDKPGHSNPKPFIPRWPDIHPAFGRLMTKTFRKEPDSRFPTDEAGKEDPTGFVELIRVLKSMGRIMDTARLEIASWTTTGIIRTGNEDAFALMHSCESRQDDLGDQALILLCDGMGGYEAGEIAAAMTIKILREKACQQKMFAALCGASVFPTDPLMAVPRDEGHASAPTDVEAVKQFFKTALKEVNKAVFEASRAPGSKRRGMGCTAEIVYLDGRNLIVGHVGDSRTYHLKEGHLVQVTRDQTLVNRLVELGTLTAEEAETHPRRNELQQAIGGQRDVEPNIYHSIVKAGDWVLVCSDGLTGHVNNKDLHEMLYKEAVSADMAARRLVNLTLIEGATDNVTIVVARAV